MAVFVTFGPVFRTGSKVIYGPAVGLDALKQVSSRLRIPVFALGGIKVNRIKKVKTAGAFGVSMISVILKADNIKAKAGEVILTLN